jgi:hypothetical protein
MEKRVSWFDFNSPDVEIIIAHLSNVDWTVFDEENFKQHSKVCCRQFSCELHSFDNNKTKAL